MKKQVIGLIGIMPFTAQNIVSVVSENHEKTHDHFPDIGKVTDVSTGIYGGQANRRERRKSQRKIKF